MYLSNWRWNACRSGNGRSSFLLINTKIMKLAETHYETWLMLQLHSQWRPKKNSPAPYKVEQIHSQYGCGVGLGKSCMNPSAATNFVQGVEQEGVLCCSMHYPHHRSIPLVGPQLSLKAGTSCRLSGHLFYQGTWPKQIETATRNRRWLDNSSQFFCDRTNSCLVSLFRSSLGLLLQ
jgi:hypothetical protein